MKLKNIKRKKLNNKGFTLIELLAVVVILAIVMGIAATSVLNSINQSKTSSLLSTAQNAANQLNTWAAEDSLITDTNKMHIGTSSEFYKNVVAPKADGTANSDKWHCLSNALTIANGGSPISILKALGLNGAADNSQGDIITGSTAPANAGTATRANCSAVRYNSKLGSYEIFLSANNQGKYYVAKDGDTNANFAFSRASKTGESLAD